MRSFPVKTTSWRQGVCILLVVGMAAAIALVNVLSEVTAVTAVPTAPPNASGNFVRPPLNPIMPYVSWND